MRTIAPRLALCSLLFAAACGDDLTPPDDDIGPSVSGVVFEDGNADGVVDPGEATVEGITVYLDLNNNSTPDATEPTAVTGADGAYTFPDLQTGDYLVRQVLPFGWRSVSGGMVPAGAARPSPPDRLAIIGGTDADAMEYPFMAGVGFAFGGDFFLLCGGALVSDRWVVSAAHCTDELEPSEVAVMVGSNDPSGAGGQIYSVRSLTMHPNYTGDTTDGFDIGLWELAEPVPLGGAVRTIDMMTPDSLAFAEAGALATTIGWGTSDNPSELLQEVHLPVVDDVACGAAYPSIGSFDTQICAGTPEGGIDSCQGDSGGPLVVRDAQNDRWVHAGITSWGNGCAVPGSPGVYGRVSGLSDWAKGFMLEPASFHRVTVEEPVTANFGLQATINPEIRTVDPRWQLTNVALSGVTGDSVAANTPIGVDFGLIDELADGQRTFDCSFDPDGPDVLVEETVDCQLGDNQHTFAGFSDGAYRTRMTVSADGASHSRSALVIAGTPTETTTDTQIADTDETDPDFGGTYYIRYFDITAATDNRVVVVQVESTDFFPYLVLYDKDVRVAGGGGGAIVGASQTQNGFQLDFSPEPGKNYLLGVSTFGQADTGDFSATIINNGVLSPTTLAP